MRSRSPANSADSSPPSPALISRITSESSSGSRGTSSTLQPVGELGAAAPRASRPRRGTRRRRRRARARPRGRRPCCATRGRSATTGRSSAYRRPTLRAAAWSPWMSGSASRRSRSAYSASRASTDSNTVFSLPCGLGRTAADRGRHDEGAPATVGAAVQERPRGRARRRPSCRSASRTWRRGRRCRGSSACPCRTGGSCAADLGVDDAVLGGAARGERAAAGAVHLVSTYAGWMSAFMVLLVVVAGSCRAGGT